MRNRTQTFSASNRAREIAPILTPESPRVLRLIDATSNFGDWAIPTLASNAIATVFSVTAFPN